MVEHELFLIHKASASIMKANNKIVFFMYLFLKKLLKPQFHL
jgi:hypothetical protein